MLESKKRFPKLFRDDLQDLIVNYRANLIAKLSITHLGFPASIQAENQAILLRLQALEPIGNREDLSIFSVLEENQKITIIGTPGSGKTTLLKLITLLASRGILSNISKFPVLLKPHSSGKETSIEKEIRREIEDISNLGLWE